MYTDIICALLALPFFFTAIQGAPQAATDSASNYGSCIKDSEVNYISQRWLNAFRSNNPVPIADAATADVRPVLDRFASDGINNVARLSFTMEEQITGPQVPRMSLTETSSPQVSRLDPTVAAVSRT